MNNTLLSISKRYFHTAALITGCFFVYSCENSQDEIDVYTQKVIMVEEATDITSFLSQEGQMRAKLTAPLMLRVLRPDTLYVEFPKSLHVDFFNDSTQVESWLKSKYGKYFEDLDKVYLRDSVVVINIKGDTLRCQDLWWDQASRIFYTDKYAEYHAKGKIIHGGKGLEASQDMTTVTFKQPTGVVNVQEENP